MEHKHFAPAQLDEHALHKLQDFEQSLHDTTGKDVIIIAYQAEDSKQEHSPS